MIVLRYFDFRRAFDSSMNSFSFWRVSTAKDHDINASFYKVNDSELLMINGSFNKAKDSSD